MVLKNLTEGTHTIEWSLINYQTLTAVVEISSTGIVTCISVIESTCTESIQILDNTIIGTLKLIAGLSVCGWVDEIGGPNEIIAFNIMDLVQGYLNLKDLGFPVTASLIMGAVAYYNGQTASGDSLTGCEYT